MTEHKAPLAGRSVFSLAKRAVDGVAGGYEKTGVFASNVRSSLLYKRKIRRILSKQKDSKDFSFRNNPFPGYNDPSWHKAFYTLTGIESDDYLPEDLYYVSMSPKLNPEERTKFYTDKNNLDKLHFVKEKPRTLGRIIVGRFLSEDYTSSDPGTALGRQNRVVIKPSIESGGGRGVFFASGEDAAAFAKKVLSETPEQEYIFQEPLKQSDSVGVLSPDSINTFRIMTINLDGAPRVVATILRVGRKGSETDNVMGGGLACGVRDGRLIEQALNEELLPYYKHQDTGVVFKDFPVPWVKDAEAECLRMHTFIPEICLISWDVATGVGNVPILIEMNICLQSIYIQQALLGPIFKDDIKSFWKKTQPKLFMGCPVG